MDERHARMRRIRRRLGPLWNVFFGGFGRLTPIQEEALPVLLDRQDAILCSPTASGKTEAALAPAVRHLLDEGSDSPGPRLLYVAPTRALVADLERRFADLFHQLGLPASFRTSDSPHLPRRFPQILVTTPESWDSLLCRRPQVWANVRTIVLDELHLLDNTYRGDQVRVLLKRLEARTGTQPVHRVALSATVSDPGGLAERYVHPAAALLSSGEARGLSFSLVSGLDEAVAICRKARRYKVLVFCNSRKECEEQAERAVAEKLWPRNAVFVHHGSLSRTTRKEAEAALKEARGGLCFATMTLELGMDIGDVAAAVLYRPPPNAEAFMQRIGRACRREPEICAIGIAESDEEAAAFRAFEIMARNSYLKPAEYRPDLSVVVQQLFSMLFAAPSGIPLKDLDAPLEVLCQGDELDRIIDFLAEEGLVARRAGRILADEAVMDMGDRGEVHANIPDQRALQVYDERTGRVVGEIASFAADGGPIALAGRVWTITGRRRGRITVKPAGGSAGPGFFVARSAYGRFLRFLPPELKARMLAD